MYDEIHAKIDQATFEINPPGKSSSRSVPQSGEPIIKEPRLRCFEESVGGSEASKAV